MIEICVYMDDGLVQRGGWKIRGELLHTGTGVNFIPLVVLALKYRDEILLGNSTPTAYRSSPTKDHRLLPNIVDQPSTALFCVAFAVWLSGTLVAHAARDLV